MQNKGLCARILAILAGGLCALFSVIGTPASAGAFRVMPIRIEMPSDKQFCALTIANDDRAPATVQVRGYGWRKDGEGNDELNPDAGIVVNPSILTIPPGDKRLVRCSLPASAKQAEESYRLVIDELPTGAIAPGTLRTLLRISIPLFRAPPGVEPRLGWTLADGSDGKPRIALLNQGSSYAQVTSVHLYPTDGKAQKLDNSFYLLAGGRIEFPLETKPPIAKVEVETSKGTLIATRAGQRH